ncbi:hypothetical protein MK805_04390 [Shimazuella sp. AN120528]|uniref:hypothetical protein n=1 Tax=Shimazuella soli TaxID=1892854 RepID=UPI001F10FBB1|nr:hypothetical protein [Shimazuella soli]MCH5584206.1 hypothetical protein [Shimazuella soli]
MSQSGDSIVLVLIILLILFLILRKWVSFQFAKDILLNKAQKEPKQIKGEVADLLREYGYEPIEGKKKIPISIELDKEPYESRMFIDFLAMKEDLLYVVLVAKERKPLRKTGAAIRDHLFPFFLLYRPAGIVYIDKAKNKVSLVQFSHPALLESQKKFPMGYVITFLIGMIFMWIIQK